MKQCLIALVVVVSVGGPSFAATILTPPAETTSTILIGAGLLLTASLARLRARRRG